jgi:uncharacterized membrane protein YjjP (DUF1212 family)
MPTRPQSPTFKAFVLLVCTAWFGVLIAVLWGLDWRWIPTTLIAAAVALLLGGIVENHLHERATDREAHRAAITAEEEAWLGGQDQLR